MRLKARPPSRHSLTRAAGWYKRKNDSAEGSRSYNASIAAVVEALSRISRMVHERTTPKKNTQKKIRKSQNRLPGATGKIGTCEEIAAVEAMTSVCSWQSGQPHASAPQETRRESSRVSYDSGRPSPTSPGLQPPEFTKFESGDSSLMAKRSDSHPPREVEARLVEANRRALRGASSSKRTRTQQCTAIPLPRASPVRRPSFREQITLCCESFLARSGTSEALLAAKVPPRRPVLLVPFSVFVVNNL